MKVKSKILLLLMVIVTAFSLHAQSDWTQDGNGLSYQGGPIGIGTSTGDAFVEIKPDIFNVPALKVDAGGNPVVVDQNGNLGIGVSDPSNSKLTITATEFIEGGWMGAIDFTQQHNSAITHRGGGLLFGMHSDRKFFFGDISGGEFQKYVMTINADNGHVGIGTDTPAAPLHIYQDGYTLYGPNTDYGVYLQIGGNGKNDGNGGTTPYASVVTTNGNLHLDAKSGAYGTYINHYSKNNTYMNIRGGDVGIGNEDPEAKLHVSGDVKVDAGLDVSGNVGIGIAGDANVPLVIHASHHMADPVGWLKAIDFSSPFHSAITHSGGGLLFGMHSNRKFYFADIAGDTFQKYVMTVDAGNGYVGIGSGSDTPLDALHVKGILRLDGVAGSWRFLSHESDGKLHIRDEDNQIMSMTIDYGSGDIGIGNEDPQAKLHVSGNAKIDAGLNVDGNVGIGCTNTSGAKLEINATEQIEAGWYSAIELTSPLGSAITYDAGGLLFGMHSNRKFYFADIDGDVFQKYIMTINADKGNVGIGIEDTDYKLHVAGDLKVDTGLDVSGTVSMFGTPDFDKQDGGSTGVAETDVLITATLSSSAGEPIELIGWVKGVGMTTSRVRVKEKRATPAAGDTISITVPVAKGEEWSIYFNGDLNLSSLTYLPLGK